MQQRGRPLVIVNWMETRSLGFRLDDIPPVNQALINKKHAPTSFMMMPVVLKPLIDLRWKFSQAWGRYLIRHKVLICNNSWNWSVTHCNKKHTLATMPMRAAHTTWGFCASMPQKTLAQRRLEQPITGVHFFVSNLRVPTFQCMQHFLLDELVRRRSFFVCCNQLFTIEF